MVLRIVCLEFVEVFFAYGSVTEREEGGCYSFVVIRVEYSDVKCLNCWIFLNLYILGFVGNMFLALSLQKEGGHKPSPLLKSKHMWAIRIHRAHNLLLCSMM